jgi:surfactin synthase thioesterase subunit
MKGKKVSSCCIKSKGQRIKQNQRAEQPFCLVCKREKHGMITRCIVLIRTFFNLIPFAFFGHSVGALISFELTQYFYRIGYGLEPVHLFISGHRAPQIPDLDPPTYHLPEQDSRWE